MPDSHKKRPKIRQARLVPRNNTEASIVRIGGQRRAFWGDLYARLLDLGWGWLLSCIALIYFLANFLFATFYLEFGTIANARTDSHIDSFQDAFFFSVQTMATIGYGKLIPVGFGTNMMVAVEALFGFTFFATVTGMAFAKLSRPTARVLFSDIAVIGPYDGKPHLMLRMANERGNRIVDATVQLVILIDAPNAEGGRMRRFYDLPLVRDKVPFMQYTWTVMHEIKEDSQLFNMTPDKLQDIQAEIIVSLTGIDETYAQTVHARHSYVADEILCNALFEDVLKREENRIEINFDKFHQTRPAKLGS